MRIISLAILIAASFALSSCGSSNSANATATVPAAAPTAIRVSADGVVSAQPAIAATSDGSRLVVFVEHADNGDSDVILQKIDAAGTLSGERVRVNRVAGEAKAWRGDPPTIVVRENTVYIGWTRKYADAAGSDVMLSVSQDGGKTFGDAVKANDDAKPAAHGMHSIAVDQAGTIYMAWLDGRGVTGSDNGEMSHHGGGEPNSEVYFTRSIDGGRTFETNKRLATEVCPCCKTSLLAANDNVVYASWRQVLPEDMRHIAVASSHDSGKTFSSEVIVSDDKWQLSACPVSGAALASPSPNVLDVLWFTAGKAGEPGTYFARSTDGGKNFLPRVLINSGGASGTPYLLESNSSSSAAFAMTNGGIAAFRWSDSPDKTVRTDITDTGTVPAVCNFNNKLSYAYVKEDNGKSSVWFTAEM